MRLSLFAALVSAAFVVIVSAGGSQEDVVIDQGDVDFGLKDLERKDWSDRSGKFDDFERSDRSINRRDWSGDRRDRSVDRRDKSRSDRSVDRSDYNKSGKFHNKDKKKHHDVDKKKKKHHKKGDKKHHKKNSKSDESDRSWSVGKNKHRRDFSKENKRYDGFSNDKFGIADLKNKKAWLKDAAGVKVHGKNHNYNVNDIKIGESEEQSGHHSGSKEDDDEEKPEKCDIDVKLPEEAATNCFFDSTIPSTQTTPQAFELALPYEVNRLVVKLNPGLGAVGSIFVSSTNNVVPPFTALSDFAIYGTEVGANQTLDVLVAGPATYYFSYGLKFWANATNASLCYGYHKAEVPDCDTRIKTNYTTNFRFCKLSLDDVDCPSDLPGSAVRQVAIKFRDPNLGAFYAARDFLPTLVKFDVHSSIGSLYITFAKSTKTIYLMSQSIGKIKRKIRVDYDVDYYPYPASYIPVSRFADTPANAATYGECIAVQGCLDVDWCDLDNNGYIVKLKKLPSDAGTITHVVAHVNQKIHPHGIPFNAYMIGSDQPELVAGTIKKTFLSGPVVGYGRAIQIMDAYIDSDRLPYWGIYLTNFANITAEAKDVYICYSYTVGAVRNCPVVDTEIVPVHVNQEDVCKIQLDFSNSYVANYTRQLYIQSTSNIFVTRNAYYTDLNIFDARLLTNDSFNRLTIDLPSTDDHSTYYVRIVPYAGKTSTRFLASTGLVLTISHTGYVCWATQATGIDSNGAVAYSFDFSPAESLLSAYVSSSTATNKTGTSQVIVYQYQNPTVPVYYRKLYSNVQTSHDIQLDALATADKYIEEFRPVSSDAKSDICWGTFAFTYDVDCTELFASTNVAEYYACKLSLTAGATSVTITFGNDGNTATDNTVVYGKYNSYATPLTFEKKYINTVGPNNLQVATVTLDSPATGSDYYYVFASISNSGNGYTITVA